jgi:hypothetical protein
MIRKNISRGEAKMRIFALKIFGENSMKRRRSTEGIEEW